LLGINFPALEMGSSFMARYSFQYFLGFGFLGFSICSSLKKQMKSNSFKRKAFVISTLTSIAIMATIEMIANYIYIDRSIQWFWNFCGILGLSLGIGVFRLLYHRCC